MPETWTADASATRGDRRGQTPRVLVVTNDFPPGVGGAENYVYNLVAALPSEAVVVLAPNAPGWREHDDGVPFPIVRWPASSLWPTSDLRRRVASLAREHRADVVLFGHALPAGLLGPDLARSGMPYVMLTHGLEVWLSRLPGSSRMVSHAFSRAREITAVSNYTAERLRRAIPGGGRLSVLHPGVDTGRFTPRAGGALVRHRHPLEGRRIVLCVGRLVPRKGQDVLIHSMSLVRHLAPDAVLVLVGEGPYRAELETMAAEAPEGSVLFAGEVPGTDLPEYYAACDVFAMPCRSRWLGLEVEGFGIVFVEAAASARPVVAGRSGGASEAVEDGRTGLLVEGGEHKAVALAIVRLLLDKGLATTMGMRGRDRVERRFSWEVQASRLAGILERAAT